MNEPGVFFFFILRSVVRNPKKKSVTRVARKQNNISEHKVPFSLFLFLIPFSLFLFPYWGDQYIDHPNKEKVIREKEKGIRKKELTLIS